MKAMILAAGRGKRMRPLTDATPKPLLKVGNYALVEHLLFKLAAGGFEEVVINLAHLGDQIKAKLGDGRDYGVHICYSHEDDSQGLETGGGIFKALPLLGKEPFLVVAGDIWTDFQFGSLKNKPLPGLAHLILVDNPYYHADGDFVLADQSLVEGEGQKLTFASIGVYSPELFAGCRPGFFPLAPLLYKAVKRGLATGEYYGGEWVNVGTPETLNDLRERYSS